MFTKRSDQITTSSSSDKPRKRSMFSSIFLQQRGRNNKGGLCNLSSLNIGGVLVKNQGPWATILLTQTKQSEVKRLFSRWILRRKAFQILKRWKDGEKKRSRKREGRTKSTTSRIASIKLPKLRKVEITQKAGCRKWQQGQHTNLNRIKIRNQEQQSKSKKRT